MSDDKHNDVYRCLLITLDGATLFLVIADPYKICARPQEVSVILFRGVADVLSEYGVAAGRHGQRTHSSKLSQGTQGQAAEQELQACPFLVPPMSYTPCLLGVASALLGKAHRTFEQ